MQNIQIGIAGGIASGKTTLARKLAENFQLQYLSFGNVLKQYCAQQDIIPSRDNLQNLGQNLIIKLGERGFMHWIVQNSPSINWKGGIVLDGFRHEDVYKEFKEIFPNSILVFCDCPEATRINRICQRDSISASKAEEIIKHPSEYGIKLLKNYADFVLSPKDSFSHLTELITNKTNKSLIDIQKQAFFSHIRKER